jgi:hypothetical protein
MDVIHNTAYIFFDGNPPIVTNTTWHTIMDCNELGTITGPEMICEGEMAEFTFPDDYVETIDWTVNEGEAGSGTPLIYSADTPGDFVVGVTVLNPLCEISQSANLEVNPLPGTVITLGDGILTAPEGASWQWFFNEETIDGATNQELEPDTDGYYSVEVMSEDGCTSLSESVYFVSIHETQLHGAFVSPNPMSLFATLRLPKGCDECDVILLNASGERVREWTNIGSRNLQIERNTLSAGTYHLGIIDRQGRYQVLTLYVL